MVAAVLSPAPDIENQDVIERMNSEQRFERDIP